MTLDSTILECKINIGQTLLELETINIILHNNVTVNKNILLMIQPQIFVLEVIIVHITLSVEIIMIQDI